MGNRDNTPDSRNHVRPAHVTVTAVVVAVGLIFAVSAFLKLSSSSDNTGAVGFSDLSVIGIAVALVEMFLCVWLLLGRARRQALLSAIALVVVFLLVSLWNTATSKDDCGCFGVLSPAPVVTVALDLLMIGALGGAFMLGRGANPRHRWALTWTTRITTACVCLLMVWILATGGVGAEGADPLLGMPAQESALDDSTEVAADPRLFVDLGYVTTGSTHPVQFTLTNPTGEPMRIVSVKPLCSCLEPQEIPDLIPANNSVGLRASFIAPEVNSRYRRGILIKLDDGTEHQAVVQADVNLPLVIEPETIGVNGDGSPDVDSLTITNRGQQPIKLVYATASNTHLQLQLKIGTVVESGQAVTIPILHADGPMVPVTRGSQFEVSTTCLTQKVICVPLVNATRDE